MLCKMVVGSLMPFLLLCLAGTFVKAQSFEKLDYWQFDERNGLSQNFAYDIVRDHRGFTWISTGDGITRYGNNSSKQFRIEDGLAENFTTCSFITSKKYTLFGHSKGLITYFDGFNFYPLEGDTLQSEIVSIIESKDSTIWCASRHNGLISWDIDLKKSQLIFPEALKDKLINQIKILNDNMLVGTNEGLYVYRQQGRELVLRQSIPEFSYQNIAAIEHSLDAPNQCWIGVTGYGVFLLILDKSSISLHSNATFPLMPDKNVSAIKQSKEGAIWIGTIDEGAFHLTYEKGFANINIRTFNDDTGYPISSLKCIYTDKYSEVAWLGTLGDGAIKVDYRTLFRYYKMNKKKENIKKIYSATNGRCGYYVATDQGLRFLQMNDEKKTAFLQPTVIDQDIVYYTFSYDDKLYVATEKKGIRTFIENCTGLEEIDSPYPLFKSIKARYMTIDGKGNWWICVLGKGVIQMSPQGKKIQELSTNTGFIHNEIFDIEIDDKQRVWFLSLGAGATMLDTDGKFHNFSQTGALPGHDVTGITSDKKGNIWISTDGQGYFYFANGVFERIGLKIENKPDYIKDIISDASGRIWTNTNHSITYYDQQTRQKRIFNKYDGLLERENYGSSFIRDREDRFLIINDKGFTLIDSKKAPPPIRLPVYFTDMEISFKPMKLPKLLPEAIMREQYPSVTLEHNQNHVTIDLFADDITYQGPIYYRYYVKEIEDTWSPPTTDRIVTYTSLNPGNYTVQAQASSNIAVWSQPSYKYTFTLKNPYWNTWWFYAAQIGVILTLFFITYLISHKGSSENYNSVRVMVFICIFVVFEYVELLLEPLTASIIGSVPIYRTIFNLGLAFFLLPIERMLKAYIRGTHNNKKAKKPYL